MRRQLSLGMLFARSSLRRVLGILLVMAAAQLALGWYILRGDNLLPVESVLDHGIFRLLSALGLTGTVAAVMLSSGGFGSRAHYAVGRLPVRRWTVWAWSAGYTLAVLVLFWAVETAVCLGVFRIFAGLSPSAPRNPQLLLLATYRSSLFHSLLPLRDTTRLVTTILYFLGLGVLTSLWTVRAFRGKWSALPMILALAWWFPAGAVGSVGGALFLAVVALCLAVGSTFKLGEEDWA